MKKFFFISWMLLLFIHLMANSNIIVKEYNFEHGLPHNAVYSAMKDADGMMWFATWYGLTSFDGVKFRSYNTRDDLNADIPPHKLQLILEADERHIWIKTIDHKLFLFNKVRETYQDVFSQLKAFANVSPKIIKIQKDQHGKLLLLTKNRDLLLANVNEQQKIDLQLLHDASATRRNVNADGHILVEDANSISWIGRDYSIFTAPKGQGLQQKPSDFISAKLGKETIASLRSAYFSDDLLWLGDRTGNLYKINLMDGNIQKWSLNPSQPLQLILVLNGNKLYLSFPDGIYTLPQSGGEIRKVIPLSNGDITTFAFSDSYDKLWFVLNQRDIVYLDPISKLSRRFRLTAGKALPDIKLEDGKALGLFALTTAGEVVLFDRNSLQMQVLNRMRQLNSQEVPGVYYDVLLDDDQILWLSSSSKGILRVSFPKPQFNLLQISQHTQTEGENAVKAMIQAKDGDIWVATRKPEVFRLNRNGVMKQRFTRESQFFPGNVYHFMEDRSGTLWLSTKGQGLIKATPDKTQSSGYRFVRFVNDPSDANSISGNDVYFTYQDSRGNIWAALFGGGLNLIGEENGATVFYHKFNSFSNYPRYGLYMEVRNIAEGKDGRMWVGTSDGLISFANDFSHPNQIEFEIYRDESVKSNVSDNDIYVLFKDRQGELWISVFGGGLNKLEQYDVARKRPVFTSYGQKEGLTSEVILSIVEEDDRYLWLATENSISRFDRETGNFRNYDRYDGFLDVRMEEESAIRLLTGELWFGNRLGILAFNPKQIETYQCSYRTIIVDFLVSNADLRSYRNQPKTNIRYMDAVTLLHHQNNIVIEFAALNYFNLNSTSYRYILEGYETEWHNSGKNRIASYPNLPPGKYQFVVQSLDEANTDMRSERKLTVTVLPPWWRTWWAYTIYAMLILLAVFATIKLILFTIKMRNDVYIEQKVSEMKIRFFTNISHELRTPLTLIMGPINELKEKQQLTDKGWQYVALIEKSAVQMLQLVNQILDFRKLQHGKMVLKVAHLDLNKLIASFQNEFEILSEEKEISYSFQLAEDDILLWGDKERLEIVVRNLISNAFKFTEPGGSIFVTTALSDDHDHCLIKVEDTGIGIPQNKINEIFERFSSSEVSRNNYYKGTGIGLNLSREIVNLHHGEIFVERKHDKGTIFTVKLLLGKDHFKPEEVQFYLGENDKPDGEEANVAHELTSTDDEKVNESNLPVVLIVEDNKDLCNMLRLQLEDRYKLLIAYNGVEGLRKIALFHPDLVVTDIMMPEMSGTELLQNIRKNFEISHIPVIILTAKQNEEAKIQAISMGANAYITKPFNKEYLIARIEQLLRDRKVFRQRIWNLEGVKKVQEEENYGNYLVKKDVQLLEKIHQVIEENLQNADFNIDVIAESLGFSRSAFFKKLKSLTGLAPVELIKEIRLTKSVILMQNTDLSISEIAFEVGFKDAGYYGKCFRKKYNQTPTEYLNSIKTERIGLNADDEKEND